MAEFVIKGRVCSSGKMDPYTQFYVQRRIGVIYPALAGARAIMLASMDDKTDEKSGADPLTAIAYVTTAMYRLSDDDWRFILNACLDQVKVKQADNLWVALKTPGTDTLQFADVGLPEFNLIMFKVLMDNFAPFIDALPSLISEVMSAMKKPA